MMEHFDLLIHQQLDLSNQQQTLLFEGPEKLAIGDDWGSP
jgi:hypothetical protein